MTLNEVTHHISQFLLGWKLDARTVVYVFFALAAGYIIGSRRKRGKADGVSFQNHGEALLSRVVLSSFAPPDYHLLNHVTLRVNNGTTQVDHIIVSRFGVFVIETKDYKGWLLANEKQSHWTQILFHWKFKFQNPIIQNQRHVAAVQLLLDFLPSGAVKSAVVFTGDAEFRTDIPRGVFRVPEFIGYVRRHSDEVMSLNRMQFCVGRLETERLAITRKTDVEHIQTLRRWHDDAA